MIHLHLHLTVHAIGVQCKEREVRMEPTDHKSSISFMLHDNHQTIVHGIHLSERKLTDSLTDSLND